MDVHARVYAELHRFCREGCYEELRHALYYEEDASNLIYVRTQGGNTLLHEAVIHNQADIVQLLLLHLGTPDVRANGGLTPLHIAATKGHVGCVKALLEGKANVSLEDDLGQDAMVKAERSKSTGRTAVMGLLRSRREYTTVHWCVSNSVCFLQHTSVADPPSILTKFGMG